jgi:predicted nucleotidyltransferase
MFKEINILKIFFEEPAREFNVREVARILKIAPATASKELGRFAKANILNQRKERMFLLYKADLGSQDYRDLKVYYLLHKIREMGLIDALNNFYLKPAIILFGSAAAGMDTETSDIDLLVISEKVTEFDVKAKFEKKLKRKLQIIPVKNISDLKNEHLINNVLNGHKIQGNIKWI